MESFRVAQNGKPQQVFINLENQLISVMHALQKHLERWPEVARRMGGDFNPAKNAEDGGTGHIFRKEFSLHVTLVAIDGEVYGLIRASGINPISGKAVEIDSYLINSRRRMLSPTTVAEFEGEDPSVVEYTVMCEILHSVLASRFE